MPLTAAPSVQINERDLTFGPAHLRGLKDELSIDFNDYDIRLKSYLEAAKTQIERYTGTLLTPTTVTVSWSELYDYESLPWGPVTGAVAVTDLLGNALIVTVSTDPFPVLTGNFATGIVLSYPAGYNVDSLPEDLRQAAIDLAANQFDKGDRDWKMTVRAYKRTTWAT